MKSYIILVILFLIGFLIGFLLRILRTSYKKNKEKVVQKVADTKVSLKEIKILFKVSLLYIFVIFITIFYMITIPYILNHEYLKCSTVIVKKAISNNQNNQISIIPSLDKKRILLESIAEVESQNNTKAKSNISSASGHLQITNTCLEDANRILGCKKYSLKDRFNRKKAEEIFNLIQNKYNSKGDIEKAIRLWNGGNNYNVISTQSYYEAVHKVYNRKIDEQLTKIVKEYKSLNL